MVSTSILLVGGPDSGKSNYLARLWLALKSRRHGLRATATPENIEYIEEISAHLLHGIFVPKTEHEDVTRDFNAQIATVDGLFSADLSVPDVYGELWQKAVKSREIPQHWLDTMQEATCAILFVRVHSPNNFQPLDWVATQSLLRGKKSITANRELPAQVTLIELLRFIEDTMSRQKGRKPKVAIVVTAWDLLDPEERLMAPEVYLENEFPMFAGRLEDCCSLDVKVFGCSIVGGTLKEGSEFTEEFLASDYNERGYVVLSDASGVKNIHDVTEPINWLLR